MADIHTAFIGSVPANYDRYLGPLIFEKYAADLARRVTATLGTGGRVLETAAGTGIATRALRDALAPAVRLVATDLHAPMLEQARAKFAADENMAFQPADAMNLPFPDATFDAVVCQFSIMFFPEKLEALREVMRVLKPGGHFLFSVWDSYEHNHLIRTVNEAIAQALPEDPPPFFDIPYGYYHLDMIKEVLGDAGFGDLEIVVLPRISTAPSAREVAIAYVLGTPVRLQIEARSSGHLNAVVDAAERALADAHGASPCRGKMQAIVITAHAAASEKS